MQAIRTIQSVEGGKLNISLPPDYQYPRVEVIILPFPHADCVSLGEPSQDWKKGKNHSCGRSRKTIHASCPA